MPVPSYNSCRVFLCRIDSDCTKCPYRYQLYKHNVIFASDKLDPCVSISTDDEDICFEYNNNDNKNHIDFYIPNGLTLDIPNDIKEILDSHVSLLKNDKADNRTLTDISNQITCVIPNNIKLNGLKTISDLSSKCLVTLSPIKKEYITMFSKKLRSNDNKLTSPLSYKKKIVLSGSDSRLSRTVSRGPINNADKHAKGETFAKKSGEKVNITKPDIKNNTKTKTNEQCKSNETSNKANQQDKISPRTRSHDEVDIKTTRSGHKRSVSSDSNPSSVKSTKTDPNSPVKKSPNEPSNSPKSVKLEANSPVKKVLKIDKDNLDEKIKTSPSDNKTKMDVNEDSNNIDQTSRKLFHDTRSKLRNSDKGETDASSESSSSLRSGCKRSNSSDGRSSPKKLGKLEDVEDSPKRLQKTENSDIPKLGTSSDGESKLKMLTEDETKDVEDCQDSPRILRKIRYTSGQKDNGVVDDNTVNGTTHSHDEIDQQNKTKIEAKTLRSSSPRCKTRQSNDKVDIKEDDGIYTKLLRNTTEKTKDELSASPQRQTRQGIGKDETTTHKVEQPNSSNEGKKDADVSDAEDSIAEDEMEKENGDQNDSNSEEVNVPDEDEDSDHEISFKITSIEQESIHANSDDELENTPLRRKTRQSSKDSEEPKDLNINDPKETPTVADSEIDADRDDGDNQDESIEIEEVIQLNSDGETEGPLQSEVKKPGKDSKEPKDQIVFSPRKTRNSYKVKIKTSPSNIYTKKAAIARRNCSNYIRARNMFRDNRSSLYNTRNLRQRQNGQVPAEKGKNKNVEQAQKSTGRKILPKKPSVPTKLKGKQSRQTIDTESDSNEDGISPEECSDVDGLEKDSEVDSEVDSEEDKDSEEADSDSDEDSESDSRDKSDGSDSDVILIEDDDDENEQLCITGIVKNFADEQVTDEKISIPESMKGNVPDDKPGTFKNMLEHGLKAIEHNNSVIGYKVTDTSKLKNTGKGWDPKTAERCRNASTMNKLAITNFQLDLWDKMAENRVPRRGTYLKSYLNDASKVADDRPDKLAKEKLKESISKYVPVSSVQFVSPLNQNVKLITCPTKMGATDLSLAKDLLGSSLSDIGLADVDTDMFKEYNDLIEAMDKKACTVGLSADVVADATKTEDVEGSSMSIDITETMNDLNDNELDDTTGLIKGAGNKQLENDEREDNKFNPPDKPVITEDDREIINEEINRVIAERDAYSATVAQSAKSEEPANKKFIHTNRNTYNSKPHTITSASRHDQYIKSTTQLSKISPNEFIRLLHDKSNVQPQTKHVTNFTSIEELAQSSTRSEIIQKSVTIKPDAPTPPSRMVQSSSLKQPSHKLPTKPVSTSVIQRDLTKSQKPSKRSAKTAVKLHADVLQQAVGEDHLSHKPTIPASVQPTTSSDSQPEILDLTEDEVTPENLDKCTENGDHPCKNLDKSVEISEEPPKNNENVQETSDKYLSNQDKSSEIPKNVDKTSENVDVDSQNADNSDKQDNCLDNHRPDIEDLSESSEDMDKTTKDLSMTKNDDTPPDIEDKRQNQDKGLEKLDDPKNVDITSDENSSNNVENAQDDLQKARETPEPPENLEKAPEYHEKAPENLDKAPDDLNNTCEHQENYDTPPDNLEPALDNLEPPTDLDKAPVNLENSSEDVDKSTENNAKPSTYLDSAPENLDKCHETFDETIKEQNETTKEQNETTKEQNDSKNVCDNLQEGSNNQDKVTIPESLDKQQQNLEKGSENVDECAGNREKMDIDRIRDKTDNTLYKLDEGTIVEPLKNLEKVVKDLVLDLPKEPPKDSDSKPTKKEDKKHKEVSVNHIFSILAKGDSIEKGLQSIDEFVTEIPKTKHDLTIGKKFTCPECDKSFDSDAKLTDHLYSHRELIECDDCTAQYHTETELASHAEEHEEYPHKCCYCTFDTISDEILHSHIQIKHNIAMYFKCDKCPASFKAKKWLRDHIRNAHPQVFNCCFCGARFYSLDNYMKHFIFRHRSDAEVTTRMCLLCAKDLMDKTLLKNHLCDVHELETVSICKQCPAFFKGYYNLTKHMKQDHNPFCKPHESVIDLTDASSRDSPIDLTEAIPTIPITNKSGKNVAVAARTLRTYPNILPNTAENRDKSTSSTKLKDDYSYSRVLLNELNAKLKSGDISTNQKHGWKEILPKPDVDDPVAKKPRINITYMDNIPLPDLDDSTVKIPTPPQKFSAVQILYQPVNFTNNTNTITINNNLNTIATDNTTDNNRGKYPPEMIPRRGPGKKALQGAGVSRVSNQPIPSSSTSTSHHSHQTRKQSTSGISVYPQKPNPTTVPTISQLHLQCIYCGGVYTDIQRYNKHLRKHASRGHCICPRCDRLFVSLEKMKVHKCEKPKRKSKP